MLLYPKFLIGLQIVLENLLLYFGSITSTTKSTGSSPSNDTIAGETTESSQSDAHSSSIDVVGLAVFKGDILVRRAYLD